MILVNTMEIIVRGHLPKALTCFMRWKNSRLDIGSEGLKGTCGSGDPVMSPTDPPTVPHVALDAKNKFIHLLAEAHCRKVGNMKQTMDSLRGKANFKLTRSC